jgi:hypothetical protein
MVAKEKMTQSKKHSFRLVLLFIVLTVIPFLSGCVNIGNVDQDRADHLVIFDGNGGYLGNKTNTIRKLQVFENSKLPKYLSTYSQDPYVVSSLGLATRQGYVLLGWYLPENATYTQNPNGSYVYLDVAEGNGIYNLAEEGAYVFGYVERANGRLIFIYVEEMIEDVHDPDTAEYIYYNGSNGFGFYIYDEDNAEQAAVYEETGGRTPSQVSKYGKSYLIYAELSVDEKTLFQDILRYNQEFYEYTDADAGLDRYDFESGYAYLDTMLVKDAEGEYVFILGEYEVYDEENPDHEELDRYTTGIRYTFVPTDTIQTPTELPRYNATITYWNFETDRVTSDITLMAHWERKLTVYYVQQSGQITQITTKRNATNTADIDLVQGELIGRLETIPLLTGYTFVGWSTSNEEYIPWNFATDVFPSDVRSLYLYAHMIEGTYTRINSAVGLARVAENPAANYILTTDIDLQGAVFSNASPLGFVIRTTVNAENTVFSGEFLAYGKTIKNFTLRVTNNQKRLVSTAGVKAITGLFPFVQDAKIEGLNVEGATILFVTDTPARGDVTCELGGAGIIGTALSGTTIVSGCSVDLIFNATTANTIDFPVYIGDIVAFGSDNVQIALCEGNIDYSAVNDISTVNLFVETID